MWGKALFWIAGSIAIAACGGATKTVMETTGASPSGSSAPAWQPGTPQPKLTEAQIAQAGSGLSKASASLGTVDEVLGSMAAGAHVDPSAKALDDQYARFGRCIGEQIGIHDRQHELALVIAYDRKQPAAQQAVEKESGICSGLQITHDHSYQQSLTANP